MKLQNLLSRVNLYLVKASDIESQHIGEEAPGLIKDIGTTRFKHITPSDYSTQKDVTDVLLPVLQKLVAIIELSARVYERIDKVNHIDRAESIERFIISLHEVADILIDLIYAKSGTYNNNDLSYRLSEFRENSGKAFEIVMFDDVPGDMISTAVAIQEISARVISILNCWMG